jgi:hypothetical protein
MGSSSRRASSARSVGMGSCSPAYFMFSSRTFRAYPAATGPNPGPCCLDEGKKNRSRCAFRSRSFDFGGAPCWRMGVHPVRLHRDFRTCPVGLGILPRAHEAPVGFRRRAGPHPDRLTMPASRRVSCRNYSAGEKAAAGNHGRGLLRPAPAGRGPEQPVLLLRGRWWRCRRQDVSARTGTGCRSPTSRLPPQVQEKGSGGAVLPLGQVLRPCHSRMGMSVPNGCADGVAEGQLVGGGLLPPGVEIQVPRQAPTGAVTLAGTRQKERPVGCDDRTRITPQDLRSPYVSGRRCAPVAACSSRARPWRSRISSCREAEVENVKLARTPLTMSP